MSGMPLSPLPAVPGVLTGSRPSQRSAPAPWAALRVPHLECASSAGHDVAGPGSHRRRATPGKPGPLAACACPAPPETGSRKYLQFSVRQAFRTDSMIRPLRGHAVMPGLGGRDGRRQRCPRRGGSGSCHRVWEAPARLGSLLDAAGHRCLEPEQFADAGGSLGQAHLPRSRCLHPRSWPSRTNGPGAVDSVLGSRVERGEPAAPGHGRPVAFGRGPRSGGVIHEHS